MWEDYDDPKECMYRFYELVITSEDNKVFYQSDMAYPKHPLPRNC